MPLSPNTTEKRLDSLAQKIIKFYSATTLKRVFVISLSKAVPEASIILLVKIIHIKDLTRISKNSINCSLCPKGGHCENLCYKQRKLSGICD